MADLDAGHRARRLDGRGNARHAFDLPVFPQAGAARRDSPLWRHTGGLDDHQSGTATGHAGIVHVVPVIHVTLVGLVLAHGWDRDAVAKGDLLQREGGEQSRHEVTR